MHIIILITFIIIIIMHIYIYICICIHTHVSIHHGNNDRASCAGEGEGARRSLADSYFDVEVNKLGDLPSEGISLLCKECIARPDSRQLRAGRAGSEALSRRSVGRGAYGDICDNIYVHIYKYIYTHIYIYIYIIYIYIYRK